MPLFYQSKSSGITSSPFYLTKKIEVFMKREVFGDHDILTDPVEAQPSIKFWRLLVYNGKHC